MKGKMFSWLGWFFVFLRELRRLGRSSGAPRTPPGKGRLELLASPVGFIESSFMKVALVPWDICKEKGDWREPWG